MSRLIAFGCSHTQGCGCEDYLSAWPYILADKLGLDCINEGVSGASGKEIAHRALNFDYEKTDIVIIMWSHWTRTFRFTSYDKWYRKVNGDKTGIEYIGQWNEKSINSSKIFFKYLYNRVDNGFEAVSHANFLYYHLLDSNIQQYHLLIENEQIKDISQWYKWNIVPFNQNIFMMDYVKPKNTEEQWIYDHLNDNENKEFASLLYSSLFQTT